MFEASECIFNIFGLCESCSKSETCYMLEKSLKNSLVIQETKKWTKKVTFNKDINLATPNSSRRVI